MRTLTCLSGNAARFALGLAVLAGCGTLARADAILTAIDAASNGLLTQQSAGGMWSGVGATGYNGTILSGLVNAYNNTGTASYSTAAQNGATALINAVNANGGSYLGDEAYALTQAANLPGNPNSAAERTAVYNFFNATVPANYVNANGYINALVAHYGTDKTQATIYLSYFTLAAYAVNAPNKADFRTGLISTLGKVADFRSDNSDYQAYPTGALGAAVWALAQTGNGLDSTPLTGPTAPAQDVFGTHTLSQLPGMLDARLVPASHTFDWLLTDPTHTYVGYTEDTAFGILGLSAADAAAHATTYAADVAAARLALTAAVNTATGATYDNVLSPASHYGVYAGRTLEALAVPEPVTAGLLALGGLGLLVRRRKTK